jgi:hypothetical protein
MENININTEMVLIEEFQDISIRGRLAYGMCCLEKMVDHFNSNNSLLTLLVFPKIWEFTSSSALDEWERYMNEIDPVCILDPQATFRNFPSLNKKTFDELALLYKTLPKVITETVSDVIQIGTANIYGGTNNNSPSTSKPLNRVIKSMQTQKILLPNIATFKKAVFNEFHGWGNENQRSYYLT